MRLAKVLSAVLLLGGIFGASLPVYARVDPGPTTSPSSSTPAASGSSSSTGLFKDVCSGNGQNSAVCQDAANKGNTNPVAGTGGILPTVTDVLAVIGGLAAVIMIIISGMTMATSGGNTEHVASARKRLTYAVVGLIVISLAWSIINFVIDRIIK